MRERAAAREREREREREKEREIERERERERQQEIWRERGDKKMSGEYGINSLWMKP